MAATATYRRDLLALRALTYRDLLRIWPAFDPEDVAPWMAGAAAITRRDRARTALLTQRYLRQHAAESGARVVPADPAPLPAEQLAVSLHVTSLAAYNAARRNGRQPADALRIAAVRSSGAASRLALNGGRSVVQRTAKAGDIRGWVRVGTPACDLCKTILGRFYPASTTAFKCHDHCACTFEPVYR